MNIKRDIHSSIAQPRKRKFYGQRYAKKSMQKHNQHSTASKWREDLKQCFHRTESTTMQRKEHAPSERNTNLHLKWKKYLETVIPQIPLLLKKVVQHVPLTLKPRRAEQRNQVPVVAAIVLTIMKNQVQVRIIKSKLMSGNQGE